jgi:hypothetical protein
MHITCLLNTVWHKLWRPDEKGVNNSFVHKLLTHDNDNAHMYDTTAFGGSHRASISSCDDDKAVVEFGCVGGIRVVTDAQEIAEFHAERNVRAQEAQNRMLHVAPNHGGWSVADETSHCPALNTQLYTVQPWFFQSLGRHDAEEIMKRAGLVDGQFLIRTSTRAGRYVLCLTHKKHVLHYPIRTLHVNDMHYISIDARTKFADLIQLVNFYTMNRGHLPVLLGSYVTKTISVPRYENACMARSL